MKSRLPRLQWIPSPALSKARGLAVSVTRADLREKLEPTRQGILRDIESELEKRSSEPSPFFEGWFDQVAGGSSPAEAVATGAGDANGRLGVLIAEWWSEVAGDEEVLHKQLQLRAGPIKTQWDTYGAGILRHIEKAVWAGSPPDDWWPDRIEVLLVHPHAGGGGDVTPRGDSFWMEAMLTDANPKIPEVLRLVWLALRVSIRVHLSGRSDAITLHRGWDLASVALVRDAAEEIGLAQDLAAGELMNFWGYGTGQQADALEAWRAREDATLPMPIRIARLTKMIASSG